MIAIAPAIPISALAFSPDGKTLAVGGHKEALLWDLKNARLLKRIGAERFSDSIHSLAYSKDGRRLALAEGTPQRSGAVRIFDVATGKQIARFRQPNDVVYSMSWSPDGKWLAAASADTAVYVWNMEKEKLAATLKEHTDWAQAVAFTSDSRLLATAGADKTAWIWDTARWKTVAKMQEAEAVSGLAFSPEGEYLALAVNGPNETAIRLRRIEIPLTTDTAELIRARKKDSNVQARMIDTGAGAPLSIFWAPQTNRIYAACSDKTVRAYGATNGSLAASFRGHGDWVYSVAATSDGMRLASGSADGTVKVWNAADGALLASLIHPAPGSDDWIILTPQAFFDASSTNVIQWQSDGATSSSESIATRYRNADKVREALAGGIKPPPPAPPATPPDKAKQNEKEKSKAQDKEKPKASKKE